MTALAAVDDEFATWVRPKVRSSDVLLALTLGPAQTGTLHRRLGWPWDISAILLRLARRGLVEHRRGAQFVGGYGPWALTRDGWRNVRPLRSALRNSLVDAISEASR